MQARRFTRGPGRETGGARSLPRPQRNFPDREPGPLFDGLRNLSHREGVAGFGRVVVRGKGVGRLPLDAQIGFALSGGVFGQRRAGGLWFSAWKL